MTLQPLILSSLHRYLPFEYLLLHVQKFLLYLDIVVHKHSPPVIQPSLQCNRLLILVGTPKQERIMHSKQLPQLEDI